MAVEVEFEIDAGSVIKRSLGLALYRLRYVCFKNSVVVYTGGVDSGVRRETHGKHGELHLDQLYISYCQRQGIKVSHTLWYEEVRPLPRSLAECGSVEWFKVPSQWQKRDETIV